ncbi:phosphonate ABC transporter substrate-binding protein [Photobacterium sanctipauli]|uniref:Phosphonate ABC transporter substrate-binding protein n=1 Tax=Photobacterium sanctipauli TaxID=1342794 RepID=A0A2T3NMW4_9GAMM|nr:phosphonate ABC transporter substrate-binding protein [Photobacterium sanctipauli]PSW16855.1 phosphonate ABC transporter substrate-binding protein [Photobacterium sanctipauli]
MLNTIKKFGRTLALAACVIAPTAAMAETPKEINFGIITTDAQQSLKQRWMPMLDDLSEALGIPVNAYFAPDYAGIIQGMRFKKVDFAYYGNKSAMEAVDRANAEIFARYIDVNGLEGYYSVLLVNSENDEINTLQDVIDNRHNLTLGNGEPNSTSGFLVPNYYAFAQNHISAHDFKRTIVTSHAANAVAIANNRVDVATNHTMNLMRLEKGSPELHSKLKVVWQSELIPSDVMTWRKDIPDELKEKARDFFLAYGKDSEEQLEKLKLLSWSGFSPADNNQLLPIRQMEAYKSLVETQDNPRLSDSEKAKRVAKYEAELAELGKQIKALEG